MRDASTVVHHEHISNRTFEEVVAAFESAVGSVENGAFKDEVATAQSSSDFELRMKSREGDSGFMRFLTLDHGAWLAHLGIEAKASVYTIGNPLIARTMITHDLRAGLHVPVRLMIYEDLASGTVRLAYDVPSSQMSRLHNDDVKAAAKALDAKLEALAERVTGAPA